MTQVDASNSRQSQAEWAQKESQRVEVEKAVKEGPKEGGGEKYCI